MKKYLFYFIIIFNIIFILPLNSCFAQESTSANYLNIPQDTTIQLTNIDDLYSNTNQKHDLIHFRLLNDLKINDEVILPKDTPIEGVITKVHASRLLGESGIIRIKLSEIILPNQQILQFPNDLKLKGNKNYTSLASSIIVPFSGLLFKGHEVNCPSGSTIEYVFDYKD